MNWLMSSIRSCPIYLCSKGLYKYLYHFHLFYAAYKPLEALMARPQDKLAMEFLKTLSERWKSGESSEIITDNSKLLSTFVRAGSVRSVKVTGKKHQRRGTTVK